MDSKRLKQSDAESILNNQVFQEALVKYKDHWESEALECKTPEDAFKVVIAKQAADEFIRVIKGFIGDGKMATYQENRVSSITPEENKKMVR